MRRFHNIFNDWWSNSGELLGKPNNKRTTDTLLNGLLAYWKLDEASGNGIDSSVNGYTLTGENNPIGEIGKVGNARKFVLASNQSMYNNSFQMPDTDFTISLWFKAASLPAADYMGLAGKMTGGSSGQFFVYTYDVQAYFLLYSSTGLIANQNAAAFGNLSTGAWYHLLAKRDKANGLLKIGINLTFNQKVAVGVINPISGIRIGARASTSDKPYNGLLDEVGIWNRLTTDAEDIRLYNA